MKDFVLPAHVEGLVKDLSFVDIDADDPRLLECVHWYISKWDLPKSVHPDAEHWMAILHEDYFVAVIGEKRNGNRLELTDFYLHPTAPKRLGIAASYGVMQFYKTLIEAKVYDLVATAVLYENTQWQRALERVFGLKPKTVIYYTEGK